MKYLKLTFFITLILSGLSAINSGDGVLPSQRISASYAESTAKIVSATTELGNKILNAEHDEILQSYVKFRKSYKQSEFLLSYINIHEVNTFINGAPLNKMAIDTDNPEVLEPCGIQVIDELLAEEELDRNAVLEQVNKLIKRFERINKATQLQELYNREIFEAIRQHITYITTLSITGFDTPGTSLGLKDAANALSQMHWCYDQYENELIIVNPGLYSHTDSLFKKGQEFLSSTDFDSFDRFGLTRDILNPLNEALLNSQVALGIEFRDEVEYHPVPVNFRAPHLFSQNFLNNRYFKPQLAENHEEVLALGKILFFDPILSANNERACASCHAPEKAFSEELSKSMAFDGNVALKRNAMTLVNSVYAHQFFHDLRAGDLSMQFEHVVTNAGEFNTTYKEVKEKINNCDEYRELFDQTFGTRDIEIRKDHINRALKTYVASLVAMNSPFDKMIRDEIPENEEVKQGYNLFMGKATCGTCHFPPTFAGLRPPDYIDTESEILGVPASNDFDHAVMDEDSGRFKSGRPEDWMPHHLHSFKTVTVRNAEISGPYFHNGAVATLEEVVDFYDRGGGQGLGLDVPNQTLPKDSLQLTENEKNQILAFLNALTDVANLTDVPDQLPECETPQLSGRIIGGKY